MRTAIYVPFPQAVPNKPVIDRVHCTHFRTGRCGVCEKVCPTGAIRFDQEDRIISENVGAIVVTTGFNVLNTDFFPEYGYGKYKDIITGIQFERLASASGPTLGEIRRPSDGKIPQKIVFVAWCRFTRSGKRYSLLFQNMLYVYCQTCYALSA